MHAPRNRRRPTAAAAGSHRPRRPAREDPREFYLAALIALCLIAACVPGCESCRHPTGSSSASDAGPDARPPRSALDAALEAARSEAADGAVDAAPPDARDAFDPWRDALPETTARGPEVTAAHAALALLRAAVGFWRLDHDARAGCPTLPDVLSTPAGGFDPATMAHDPWGSPYEIECAGTYVLVRSLGPDRARGTPDDLVER